MIQFLNALIQSVVPQVYDDSLSSMELQAKIVAKLNAVITTCNDYFSVDVKTRLTEILTEWQTSGKLNLIINEALQSAQDQLETDQTALADRVSAAEGTLATHGTTLTSQAGSITSQGTAISALTDRITAAEDVNTSQGTTLTSQGTAISGLTTGKAAKMLTGKNVVVYGDSIAWGQMQANPPYISSINWPNRFAELTGAVVTNRATGGTTMANTGSNSFVNLVDTDSFAGFDICMIAYGTNDFGNNIAMGRDTYATPDKTKFKDALQYSILRLQTVYPSMQLVYVTPAWITTQAQRNTQLLNRWDYLDAIHQICDRYNVPVIDMTAIGIHAQNAATMYWDGVMHPTEATYTKFGDFIAEQFPGSIGLVRRNLTFYPLTMLNGAVAGTPAPAVAMGVDQMVHFRGIIQTCPNNTALAAFNLPLHMTPVYSLTKGVMTGDGIHTFVTINTDTAVRFGTINKGYDLSDIAPFYAGGPDVVS